MHVQTLHLHACKNPTFSRTRKTLLHEQTLRRTPDVAFGCGQAQMTLSACMQCAAVLL